MLINIIQIGIPTKYLEIILNYLEIKKVKYSLEEKENTLATLNLYDLSLENLNTINQIIKN